MSKPHNRSDKKPVKKLKNVNQNLPHKHTHLSYGLHLWKGNEINAASMTWRKDGLFILDDRNTVSHQRFHERSHTDSVNTTPAWPVRQYTLCWTLWLVVLSTSWCLARPLPQCSHSSLSQPLPGTDEAFNFWLQTSQRLWQTPCVPLC